MTGPARSLLFLPAFWRRLFPVFAVVALLLVSGCATTPKGTIVLLPEGDHPSGEVTVQNAQGVQVLDQSWQAVEVRGKKGAPGDPVVLGEAKVQKMFAPALAAMPVPPVHFVVYFQLDSTELTPESKVLLPQIVQVIRERHPAMVSVVGHTDTVGSLEYNYDLGLRRAAAVFEQLTRLGAVTAGVESVSRGKTEPQVKTSDQVLEPRNRRAEVIVR